jgi:hypothetical protein
VAAEAAALTPANRGADSAAPFDDLAEAMIDAGVDAVDAMYDDADRRSRDAQAGRMAGLAGSGPPLSVEPGARRMPRLAGTRPAGTSPAAPPPVAGPPPVARADRPARSAGVAGPRGARPGGGDDPRMLDGANGRALRAAVVRLHGRHRTFCGVSLPAAGGDIPYVLVSGAAVWVIHGWATTELYEPADRRGVWRHLPDGEEVASPVAIAQRTAIALQAALAEYEPIRSGVIPVKAGVLLLTARGVALQPETREVWRAMDVAVVAAMTAGGRAPGEEWLTLAALVEGDLAAQPPAGLVALLLERFAAPER